MSSDDVLLCDISNGETMNSFDELPLTEATFYILLSLAQQPLHGYAIMKEVNTLSDGKVNLSTGTLYGAIKRLLAQGWIARIEGDDAVDGRGRKEYTLTKNGHQLLCAEIERMDKLIQVARLNQLGEEI
jgi:DNA-binding PadR family transcriptional regulator